MGSYVDILLKSLEKKISILENIEIKNQEQSKILKENPFDVISFDNNTEEKGKLIDQLVKIDEGFDVIYNRVRTVFIGEKEKYVKEIKELQKLISQTMDLSVSIQAHESRNKEIVKKIFANERHQRQNSKKVSKASLDYYMNMNKTNYVDPQFLDQNK